MSRLVYACRLEVDGDGLEPVISAYSGWIEGHYRNRRGIADFKFDLAAGGVPEQLPPGHSLQTDRLVARNGQVIRVSWAFPVETDPSLEWRNDVRFGVVDGGLCAVEHTISVNSVHYLIVPARLSLGSPGVIRYLCSKKAVQVGDMNVKATSYPMGTNAVPQFLELLQSSKRRLPIVFVSPYANGDPTDLDIDGMAQRLAAMAVVVRASEVEATWNVSEEVGRALSCFDGAARIYWPGFSTDDDPRVHRLYFGARIRDVGPAVIQRAIERAIFAVAAFRFTPDARLSEIVRDAEHADRQQKLERQKSANEWEGYAIELDEKLTAANETISNLQAEIDNLKANQKVIFSARGAVDLAEDADGELDEEPPSSAEEACKRAKEKCANLIVLDSALQAAVESPFKRPADILAALSDLDAIAANIGSGDILQQLKERGWGKRSSMHISDTTKAKYSPSYKFEYGGQRQFFEPHITIGAGDPNSCASIHFIVDGKLRKIVIGHVGKHLPNTKT